MNVLVIDIGTSSMRGILFDQKGTKLSVEQVKYEPVKLPDGRIEQDPADWTGSVEQIVRGTAAAAKKQGNSIDAVAVTAQRSAIIPIDRDGRPLMNTIMWQDRRNAGICKELEPFNALVFEKSGAKINTVFSGSRMTWIRRNCPEIDKKLYKFVNIPEYVMHHMTGEYRTDVTYGSRSHLMNLRERKWDPEMLKLFEIREEELCALQEPGSVCGHVTAEFAAKTGMTEGIPVISSGGDQQCAAVGQGAFQEGNLSIVAGTGGFLVAALDQVPEALSDQLICNCSSVAGRYMVEANVLTCCSAFDWFGKNFYPTAEDGKIDYALINRELQELDGQVGSVLALPYFQGRSTPEWNPDARAIFGEVSLATGRRDMVKGLLEGIFMEIQNNIRLFADYASIQQAYISGGLTNSPVINQIQADVYGILLYHMKDSESTALGALMTALVGQKVYPSLKDAFDVIRGEEQAQCYTPRENLHKQYEEKRTEMSRMYRRLYPS